MRGLAMKNELTHDKAPSTRDGREDLVAWTTLAGKETPVTKRMSGEGEPAGEGRHHAAGTSAAARKKPALRSRVCRACHGTRLVTDPTGTVHARGSEVKMQDCCTASSRGQYEMRVSGPGAGFYGHGVAMAPTCDEGPRSGQAALSSVARSCSGKTIRP